LRATLDLPKLPAFELDAALSLQVQSLSPFSKTDLVWSHEVKSMQTPSTMTRVDLVMTSRNLVLQHLAATQTVLNLQTSEVLASGSSGGDYLRFTGFGEAYRSRQRGIWIWINLSLVIVALALIGALAVTPSVQLFFRFMQGYRAMAELQAPAAPVLAQRESFVRTSEQLSNLSDIVGKSVPPLKTLTLITQALPDDTSLLNLQIKDSKVSISGQTGNAAALMKLLDSTPGLRDVRAPSPATKPLGATRESFAVEFTLDPAQLKSVP
jgi:general secretion pathway protein L